MSEWTFLTNHGHVLLCIARDHDVRIRDLATMVGISERSAQGIVADLEAEGYVRRIREGRRNRYELDPNRPFRHPVEASHRVGEIFRVFNAPVTQAVTPPRGVGTAGSAGGGRRDGCSPGGADGGAG